MGEAAGDFVWLGDGNTEFRAWAAGEPSSAAEACGSLGAGRCASGAGRACACVASHHVTTVLAPPSAVLSWARQTSTIGLTAREGFGLATLSTGTLIVMGGIDFASNRTHVNDVWRSTDGGVLWAAATHSVSWSARRFPAVVVIPGSDAVLLMGGVGSTLLRDCWISFDAGFSFTEATASASWTPRHSHAAVALSDGTVLVMGGDAGTPQGDVWQSKTLAGAWTLVTDDAEWGPRYGATAVVLADGSVVLAGGVHEGTPKSDVWRSADRGLSWQRQSVAPWSGREAPALVALPDSGVAIVGSTSGGAAGDVWRSHDAGQTWERVSSASSWPARAWFKSDVLPDGRIVVVGGLSTNLDVWVAASAPLWVDAPCDQRKPAICAVKPHTVDVALRLPDSAGSVDPPNVASNDVVVTLSTPRASMEVLGTGPVHSGGVEVAVNIDAPIANLVPASFVVSDPVGVTHVINAVVSGSAASWTLSLSISAAGVGGCPPGFGGTPGSSLCVRAVEQHRTWEQQQSTCAPYGLAVVESAADNAAVTSARQQQLFDYWYASRFARSLPSVEALTRALLAPVCFQDWHQRHHFRQCLCMAVWAG